MSSTLKNYNIKGEKEFDLFSQCLILCSDDNKRKILLGILDSRQYIFKLK